MKFLLSPKTKPGSFVSFYRCIYNSVKHIGRCFFIKTPSLPEQKKNIYN